MKKLFTILCFLMIVISNGSATHIIGGEIFYDCLGNNQYLITIKLYRDCFLGQAPYDNPLSLGIYNASNQLVQNVMIPFPGSSNVPPTINNPCFQAPSNVCVEEAIYTTIVTLPPTPGGYTLVYQRCCRNNSIVNLINPGNTGATYVANIPPINLATCNSSPRFNEFPPIVICTNDTLVFDHSATDPDGDSLVYSFCNPFLGATATNPMPSPPGPPPYGFVTFAPPYNANYALASSPAISINPQTGLITALPNQIGQYVVAVCVTEFRNGVPISTNKRDFQFNVVACQTNVTANFIAPITIVQPNEQPCKGLEVSFVNQSVNSTYYFWDFGVPDISTDVSTAPSPVYNYPAPGTYTVMLVANPGYSCADTAYQTISLFNELIPQIQPVAPQCIINNSFNFSAIGVLDTDANYTWQFAPQATIPFSTSNSPSGVSFLEPGTYMVYLTVETALCLGKDSIEVVVFPALNTELNLSPQEGCVPFSAYFLDNTPVSPGATYFWTLGNGATSNQNGFTHIYQQPGTYDVSLTLINTVGCIDTAYVYAPGLITVKARPQAGLSVTPQTTNILNPVVYFTDLSQGAVSCVLVTGTGVNLTGCSSIYSYPYPGNFNAMAIAVNDVGCRDTAYALVKIEPNVTLYIPNVFTPNEDGINDFFTPLGEGIEEFRMLIFDRWGEVIYETNSMEVPWNGKVRNGNELAQNGVYVYRVDAKDAFGKFHTYIGRVSLVR